MLIIKIKGMATFEIQTYITEGHFVGALYPAFIDDAGMEQRLYCGSAFYVVTP